MDQLTPVGAAPLIPRAAHVASCERPLYARFRRVCPAAKACGDLARCCGGPTPRDCCSPAPCYTNLFCCIDIVDVCPTLLAAPAGDALSDRVTRACTGWSEFPPVPDNIGAAVAAARRRAAAAANTTSRSALELEHTSRTAARPQRHAATDDDAHRTAHRVDLWV